jgi:hypothetical protein
MRLVNLSPGADRTLVRDYARRVGLPARELPHYHGTATSWQNHTFAGTSAFVVELPAGALGDASARRHADAVLGVAGARAAAAAVPRPDDRLEEDPVRRDRQAQMRAYARRHYGLDRARLTDPKVIVEHMTATSRFTSAWNTFASNARDPELHELPARARTSSSTRTARSTSSSRCAGCAATRSASTGPRSGSSTSARPTPR